jgi:hypothetical protein
MSERHTYTLTFEGTMYIDAFSADEAYEEMSQMLSDVASDFEIQVSE